MNKLTVIRLRILAILFCYLALNGLMTEQDTKQPICNQSLTQCN